MKKKRSLFMKSVLGIFSIGFLYAALMFVLIISCYREVPPKDVPIVIVLGARVYGEDPALPTKALAERLDTAYDYLVDNPTSKVVVTGGQGSDESEPEGVVMGRYLAEKGISEDRIIVENTSTSTIENIKNAGELTDISSAVVVSSDYHIYRAKHIASKYGVDTVYGLAAPSNNRSTFLSYIREILSLGYHFIFTR